MKIIFEIPPDQFKRIAVFIDWILSRSSTLIACVLALAVLAAALAALVYAWKL